MLRLINISDLSLFCGAMKVFPNMCISTPSKVNWVNFTFRLKKNSYWNTRRFIHSLKPDEDIKSIRNIGIIAHIDAGKTTTTERMLYYSGFSRVMGEVHDGDTVMDYMDQERERGITITSAAISFYWMKHRINLIDTPGHVDFTIEVERSLRVLDGAVVILDASAGVEAQTMTVWSQSNKYTVPRIIYLNKMDKNSADLDMCLKSIKNKLKCHPLLLHFPIYEGKEFRGVIDIITMEKVVWKIRDSLRDDGRAYTKTPLDANRDRELYEEMSRYRELLIETLADLNDEVAEKILSSENLSCLSVDEIHSALRHIVLKQNAIPILCGSSYRNIGVQLLMDAVISYLPNPMDRHYDFVQFYKGELCALAFKIIHDKQRGALTFLRLYSGHIQQGQKLYNATNTKTEKIDKLMVAFADEFLNVSKVSSGNIAVVTGLKDAVSGDIFVSSSVAESRAKKAYAVANNIEEKNVLNVVGGIEIPEPVFFCTIEPPSLSFQNQLDFALQCLQREDPTFKVEVDADSSQTIISGMGELHIEVIKDRIYREYGVDAYLGELQIAYKEMPQNACENTFVLEKTLGGNKHFVKIAFEIHPDSTSGKFKSLRVVPTKENELGTVRFDHLTAVKKGVQAAFNDGPLLGFNVINTNVHLNWLEVGPRTSLSMITAAASQCALDALKSGKMQLLEPIMILQITVDSSYLGKVLADLSCRRTQIIEIQDRDDCRVVINKTPLGELRNYSTVLRTLTSGNATFSMEFDCYQKMLPHEEAKAIEQVTGFAPM